MEITAVVIIEIAAIAGLVAIISPIIVVLVRTTNIWTNLDSTVKNLSMVVTDLSKLIKDIQILQSDMLQRIAKEETAVEILSKRVERAEERIDKLDRG